MTVRLALCHTESVHDTRILSAKKSATHTSVPNFYRSAEYGIEWKSVFSGLVNPQCDCTGTNTGTRFILKVHLLYELAVSG